MKLKVDQNVCIGCGACQAVCPNVFEVDEVAKVIVDEVPEEEVENATDAMEGCPVLAISEVKETEE